MTGHDDGQPTVLEFFELVAEIGDKHLQEMSQLRLDVKRNTDAVEELRIATETTNELLERLVRFQGRR